MSEKVNFSETVNHLKIGYSNSQNVARFIDQKSAAVFGAVSVVTTLDVALFKWLLEFLIPKVDEINCWVFVLLFILTVYVAFACFSSILRVFWTLVPGDVGSSLPSSLFAFIPPRKTDTEIRQADAYEKRIDGFKGSVSEGVVIEDFTEQLKQMGRINFRKITNCQKAIFWLLNFFFGSIALAIFCLVLYCHLLS